MVDFLFVIITLFVILSYRGIISGNLSKSAFFEAGGSLHFVRKFQIEGASAALPSNDVSKLD